jgi:hypothetical protein
MRAANVRGGDASPCSVSETVTRSASVDRSGDAAGPGAWLAPPGLTILRPTLGGLAPPAEVDLRASVWRRCAIGLA